MVPMVTQGTHEETGTKNLSISNEYVNKGLFSFLAQVPLSLLSIGLKKRRIFNPKVFSETAVYQQSSA